MTSGLEEGKAYGVGAGRRMGPGHRGRDAGHRNGGGEVVGQLGLEDRATPFEPRTRAMASRRCRSSWRAGVSAA